MVSANSGNVKLLERASRQQILHLVGDSGDAEIKGSIFIFLVFAF